MILAHLVLFNFFSGASASAATAETTSVDTHDGWAFAVSGPRKKHEKDHTVRRELEAAFASFNEAPASVREEVARIVRPVAKRIDAEAQRMSVDLAALTNRAELVARLLEVYARIDLTRLDEEDEGDVEFLLLSA